MNVLLEKGLKGEYVLKQVENEHTAKAVGSGSLLVLASPVLATLFEKAACNAIEHAMVDGTTTVGSFLELKHLAPTPVGMSVRVVAELMDVNGRFLAFDLTAYDDEEQIGAGVHHRILVDGMKFAEKAKKKLKG